MPHLRPTRLDLPRASVRAGVGYTGHVHDGATRLIYMQQRYYDPILGLFLSVDPVTAYSNPVAQFHRYRYANNNPYRFTDPDGRAACPEVDRRCVDSPRANYLTAPISICLERRSRNLVLQQMEPKRQS
ncbi:MAG: hypothetical protein DI562_10135 [Stenotrophomonas acidaminiphila]|nr:MAG: hypothetical protein DI562_10135 [Stenotrophomonas acidaminiphila]